MVTVNPDLQAAIPSGLGRVLAYGQAAVIALREAGLEGSRIHRVRGLDGAAFALERHVYDAVVVDEARLARDREADLAVLEFHRADAPLYVVRGAPSAAAAKQACRPLPRSAEVPTAPTPAPPLADATPPATPPAAAERPRTSDVVASFADACLDLVGDLSALEWLVLETLAGVAGARRASLLTAHGRRPLLCGRAAIGPGEASVATWRVPFGHGLAGRVAERGRALVGRGERGGLRCYEGQTYVLLPLGRDGLSIGVIGLTDLEADALPDDATLALWAALAERGGRALRVARRVVEAERNAIIDPLTRLPNRRAYEHAIERELSRAARHGDRLGLAILDIDHFSQVNNRYGHEAGDAVLAEFARRLQPAFRTTDMLARWGGEEFVVILPSLAPEPGPEDLLPVERARQMIANRPFRLPGGQGSIRVTLTAGVATYPENGTTAESLMRAADRAMYRGKSGGRNRSEAAE